MTANLARLLVDALREAPRGPAVDDGERRVTYGELAARVAGLARGLEGLGVGLGTRVAILARNRLEYVELDFALFALGAVVLPINWRLRASEVAFVLEDAGATLAFVEAEFLPLCPEREGLARVTVGAQIEGLPGLDGLRTEGTAQDLVARLERWTDGDAPAVQMYTSGTTGLPKGAMLSHAAFLALVEPWRDETGLVEGERFLQVTPLFHVGGMLMVLTCAAARATLRTMPEFLPRPALEILLREGVAAALFVPTMVRWLAHEARAERPRFPELRLLIYGAAPMPVPLLEEALQLFGCEFLQGYGLTETAGVVTVLRPEDHRFAAGTEPPQRLASAGRAIACCEVRVVDPQGRPVAPGVLGEVVARGTNLMLGYWNRPEASAEDLREGWLWTGDLGHMDAEGFVYLVDRRKDMICVAGENVYPREIEEVLARHPGVGEAAVIGIPHEHWGEEVLALVVARDGASSAPHFDRTLVQHCRAHLARFKCPTRLELRESLPRNAAGKLLKKELRAPYWEGRERKV